MVVVDRAVRVQPVLCEIQRADVTLTISPRTLLARAVSRSRVHHEVVVEVTVTHVVGRSPPTGTII